jgi:hypothetical protein
LTASPLGKLTPLPGTCDDLFGGEGVICTGGQQVGFIACPMNPPEGISFLYEQGTGAGYLAWSDTRDGIIGLARDPALTESELFSWWQSDYPNMSVAALS